MTTSTPPKLPTPLNLVGQFLIAMPNQQGDAFERTVIYICEHNDKGALGLVVNRTADVTLSDVLTKLAVVDEMSIQYVPHATESVLMGGPVQTERGFVLHTPFHQYAATIQINDNLGLTSSRDILEDVARGQGPEHMLLALGYAGWGAGQLEDEISRNAWLTVEASEHVLFETLPRERYQQAMRLLGIDAAMLSEQTGHA
ncbi:MAG: YqgE/AlgH family protein [Formosimonas sp.]